jgi:hypothetical protein
MKNRERVKKTLKVKHHWKTPDEGVIKINKNASFFIQQSPGASPFGCS